MRLLQYVESDGSPSTYQFSLTKCNPRKPPPYAILSHRWGTDADEVTFRDIEQGTAETRAGGYKKLQFCAAQAARDGLRCFWVDTCCIDKTSSAELQEAINSMYHWYNNAAKCYVYLPDVSTEQGQEWEAAFHKSEWFERGWTLQELIAPRVVEFFSVEGTKLGDKQSLEQQVHQITGISIEALQGRQLLKISEQERFSWAVERRTTVEEDAVYCLLGIFDVHMPLLYGEGHEKARTRLRRKIQLQTRSELVKEVADWYSPTDFADQQTDQLARLQPGTGDWFLARPEYLQWREQANSTLLCPGIPGSGKSVMVATVINDLQTCSETRTDTIVAYLYCNFNRQADQDLDRLLATLVRQLFQEQALLPDTVGALHARYEKRATRPTIDELRNVLRSLIPLYRQVFVVVDALDECGSAARDDLLEELFLQQSKTTNINLLATTRFIPEIIEKFSGHTQLEVRADKSDLETYLANRIHRLPRFVLRDIQLQAEIKGRIVDAAEGMFLLARLQFDSLRDKTNRGQMRDALTRLEKGSVALDGEYAKTIDRIERQDEGYRDLARRTILWITYATRQLSIDELQEALAIDLVGGESSLDDYIDDEEQILSVCHGLVEVDQESRIVRLVHYTTQEYFGRERERWLPDGNSHIARSCLTYLSMDLFAQNQAEWQMDLAAMLQEHKFLEYAGKYWGTHAQAAQRKELHADVMKFLSNDDYLRFSSMVTLGCFDWYKTYKCYQSGILAMHIGAYFGLDQVTRDFIQQRRDLNCKDSSLSTPLLYAVVGGHTEAVKLLLAQPSIEVNTKGEYGDTPLSEAASRGHTEIVQLLLAQPGIEVDIEDRDGHTPFFRGASSGHTEIVQLLLTQPGIEVNKENNYGDTPLSEAAGRGHTEIVQLLLAQPGIEVNTEDRYGHTPLSRAANSGHSEIVQLLLAQPGIEVNKKNSYGETPLSETAKEGQTEIVQLLLAQLGIEVNTKDRYGDTPLSKAAKKGQIEIVQLLLAQPGIKVNIEDRYGNTPLSSVAGEGYIEIVQLLLTQPGIEVNKEDVYGDTPLSIAARGGHIEIVQLLLSSAQPGIEDSCQNRAYWAHWARFIPSHCT